MRLHPVAMRLLGTSNPAVTGHLSSSANDSWWGLGSMAAHLPRTLPGQMQVSARRSLSR